MRIPFAQCGNLSYAAARLIQRRAADVGFAGLTALIPTSSIVLLPPPPSFARTSAGTPSFQPPPSFSFSKQNRTELSSSPGLPRSVPLQFEPYGVNNHKIIEDAPNLDEWRKQMRAAGTPDPLERMTAAERQGFVDGEKWLNPYSHCYGRVYNKVDTQ